MNGAGLLLFLFLGLWAKPADSRESSAGIEFRKALAMVDRGDSRAAMAAFRELVVRYPDLSEAWNNLAALEAAGGDLDASRQSLRMALECREASQVALRNLDRVVGRMAKDAYETAIANNPKSSSAPQLELVRDLRSIEDSVAARRDMDSLKISIRRLTQDRDSLLGVGRIQSIRFDSVRTELARQQSALDRLTRTATEQRMAEETLRKAYGLLQGRSDSLRQQMLLRQGATEQLRKELTMRTQESDSLRKTLRVREAERDSLERSLAQATRERIEAKRELQSKSTEVERLKSDIDGPRQASNGLSDLEPRASTPGTPISIVQQWSEAWSRKDVEGYLSYYSESFSPSGGRTEWESTRRSRLSIEDSIDVKVLDPRITKLPSGNVEILFRQSYKAGTTRLTTRKRIELRREVPGWKIVSEEAGVR